MDERVGAALAAVGDTGDGLLAVDMKGSVVGCNEVAAAMLGVPREALGRACWEVVGPLDGASGACGPSCTALKAARAGQAVSGRIFHLDTDARAGRAYALSLLVLRDPEGRPALLLHLLQQVTVADRKGQGAGAAIGDARNRAPCQAGSRHLTPREEQVLDLLMRGANGEAIASGLCISRTTARNHVQNILRKLGAHSKLEAVARALAIGPLPEHLSNSAGGDTTRR